MSAPSPLLFVKRQLDHLRTRIRTWFVVDGLGKICTSLLLVVFLSFWIDRLFRMDRAQRAILLLLVVGATAWMVWRFILRPIRSRVSDDALLLEIEQQNPELHETVISAFQLDRERPSEELASPALVDAAISEGVQQAKQISFPGILREGRFAVNIAMLAVGIIGLLAIGISIVTTNPMSIWFNRNVLLGKAQWPQDYYLHVVGANEFTFPVPRGEDWPLMVNVEPVVRTPDSLQVEIEDSGGKRREVLNRKGKLDFQTLLRDVQEAYRFRIVGKHAASPWHDVRLVERPEVQQLELMSTPPSYTGLGETPLPPGRGPYYVLKGTALAIQGTSDQEIVGAELRQGQRVIPLDLDSPTSFSGAIDPEDLMAGEYIVSLLGIESVARPGSDKAKPLRSSDDTAFTLRAREDKPPKVRAHTTGIGNLIVTGARIPYTVTVEDDFSVTSVILEANWTRDASGESQASNGTYRAAPPEIAALLNQKELTADRSLEMPVVQAPEGARLSMSFYATDNDTVTGPKTNQSQALSFRVVNSATLREDILRREKDIRHRFEQSRKKQSSIGTEILAVRAEIGDAETLSDDQRFALNRTQKEQQLLASRVRQVRESLVQISMELRNNRLEAEDSGVFVRRSRDIIDPLQKLAETGIPFAAAHLDSIRRLKPKERKAAFQTALDNQKLLLNAMDEILKFMVKNEDFQLAVNLLHEIRKAQENVRHLTEDEKRKRLKDLLK